MQKNNKNKKREKIWAILYKFAQLYAIMYIGVKGQKFKKTVCFVGIDRLIALKQTVSKPPKEFRFRLNRWAKRRLVVERLFLKTLPRGG